MCAIIPEACPSWDADLIKKFALFLSIKKIVARKQVKPTPHSRGQDREDRGCDSGCDREDRKNVRAKGEERS